uniref:FTH domain-containing protein n=1 Tax=Caenorhabditis tropicalis TaxID=1561998 RepID=A0A1I7TI95_9PELO
MSVEASTPCSLLDMTADELDIIMGYVDCKEIQVLRKVCSTLRQHIDNSSFDSKIQVVRVTETLEKIKLSFCIEKFEYTTIEYQMHPEGCLIKWDNKSKFLEGSDYATVAGNDLGSLLRHQKTTISDLFFEKPLVAEPTGLERFLTVLSSHLQSRKTYLPVSSFDIVGITKEKHLMKFIPYLEPKTLADIEFRFYNYYEPHLKLKNVLELDQWKLARTLSTEYIYYCPPLKTLVHFASAIVEIKKITKKDVALLRRIFEEPKWSGMTIHYSFIDKRKLGNWLNVSNLDEGEVVQIFRTDSNKHLQMVWWPSRMHILFSVVVNPVV